jgi:hypothetical protein
MGRRTLLLLVGTLGACLICCVIVFFVALPRTRDSVDDAIRESMSTQVARVVAPIGTAEPGTYTITDTELLNQFNDRLTGGNIPIENLNVVITPEHIELSFSSGSRDVTYTGSLQAVDGKLQVETIESSSGFMDFLFPASDVAEALETGVNAYLSAQGLQVTDVTMGDGEVTLVVDSK